MVQTMEFRQTLLGLPKSIFKATFLRNIFISTVISPWKRKDSEVFCKLIQLALVYFETRLIPRLNYSSDLVDSRSIGLMKSI